MAKDYTAIRVEESAKEAAEAAKREGETWSDYIQRCTTNPPEVTEFVEASDEHRPVTLEATEYRKIADEVEKCLR